MKRANGTGTIVKLSGNRRRPYVVRISSRNKYGRIVQNALSYHEKLQEAQKALDEYNRNKAAGIAPAEDKLALTVQEVYNLWSKRKYENAGSASILSYKASWKRVSALGDMKMRSVTIDHLQSIIDQGHIANLSGSSLSNDKNLMRALFRFAMERDIVVKDYSAFIELPSVEAKYKKGAFSDTQVAKLEKMAQAGVPWADTALILCYTGFRIAEFLALSIFSYDKKEECLTGGMKTAAGKNRIVPIHPKIKPFLEVWIAKKGETLICRENGGPVSPSWYREHAFKPIAKQLGAPEATPHWCRHTFASRLHAAGANQLEKKRLLGHSNGDITEHYTHTDIAQLRAAILMLA